MIYLDTSALVKLARREAETDALRAWLAENQRPLVASALVRTETARALRRSAPEAVPALRSVLALVNQFPVSDAVLDAAAALPEPGLRSLDAIHLATASMHASLLTWFVAYDVRLATSARAHGLPVATPS